jgi:adenine-specific DNA-methyltransferase
LQNLKKYQKVTRDRAKNCEAEFEGELLMRPPCNEQRLSQHNLQAQFIRNVGHRLIDFLAQIENFQKRLFEKKKFVIRTDYCITIDRVPKELWNEIIQNRDQLAEWRQLYGVDPQPTRDFLREHPYLVVDTCHFSEDFKWRLLAHFDDLDKALDGLLIKSENFQALNLLMERYRGQVKCIYIDPPYNTGSDEFVYRDDYQHSSWLSMMYDRLALGRVWMREDGAIFVSIDDREQDVLRKLMEAIFGRNNFINNIIWQKKFSPQNDAKWLSDNHDFLLLFAKSKEAWHPGLLSRTEAQDKRYQNPDNDPRGPWMSSDLSVKTYSPEYDFPITTPSGRVVRPPKGYCWRVSRERLQELIADNRIWFGPDGNGVPRLKRFLSETKQGITPLTIWSYKEVGHNQEGKQELKSMLSESDEVFGTPKPSRLLGRVITIGTSGENNALILDFFAGSGTTAHAVINLNREDGGRRKYILVEMGDYFETVLLKRIKKVVYSDSWKDGKPQKGKGISHFFKYLYLEQYEDTLNNLELPQDLERQLALGWFDDEYLMRCMLKFETQDIHLLLNHKQFQDPFNYKIKIWEGNEIQECVVDLVETFNYLLGIHVKKMRQFQNNGRLYRAVLGEKDSKRIVIIWRPLNGLHGDTNALQQDQRFIQSTVLPALIEKCIKPARLLVNGICYLPEAETIEYEFNQLMWAEEQNGK